MLEQDAPPLADELLALLQLGGAHFGVDPGQGTAANREVPGLVAVDAGEQILDERILAVRDDALEDRERDPLDQDLHSEVRDVERAALDRVLEESFERMAHGIANGELVAHQPR